MEGESSTLQSNRRCVRGTYQKCHYNIYIISFKTYEILYPDKFPCAYLIIMWIICAFTIVFTVQWTVRFVDARWKMFGCWFWNLISHINIVPWIVHLKILQKENKCEKYLNSYCKHLLPKPLSENGSEKLQKWQQVIKYFNCSVWHSQEFESVVKIFSSNYLKVPLDRGNHVNSMGFIKTDENS